MMKTSQSSRSLHFYPWHLYCRILQQCIITPNKHLSRADWKKHKLESRLPAEISITSDMHWVGITGKMDQRKELKMSLAMTWFRPLTAEVHNVSTWWVAGPGWGPRFPDTLCVFLTLSQGACPLLGGSARWTRALLGMQLSGEARLRQREDKPPPSFCPGKSRRTVFLLVGPETLLPPWDGVSGASPLW